MEHIATTLGVDIFLGSCSARKAVMKRARPGRSPHTSDCNDISHRDSLLCLKRKYSHDDDDTMSTLSATSSDSSFGCGGATVTFAHPLVTAVHYRPRTAQEEKSKLYYREADYREFRHEYIYGRRQRKRVNFSSSLVSEVWAYEAEGDKAALYYAQADLQRYVAYAEQFQQTQPAKIFTDMRLRFITDFLTTSLNP